MEPLQNIRLSFQCPRRFNQLQPCNGGWYCDGCQKMVHDYRGWSEEQIRSMAMQHDTSFCALFDARQIRVAPKKSRWYKWASAALMALGLTTLHQKVLAQQSTQKTDTATAKSKPASDPTQAVFGTIEIEAEPYGGMETFYHFIYRRIAFDNITDRQRAIIAFVVEKDGSLSDIHVVRSNMSKEGNAQIIRAIYMAPKWHPGTRLGQPVRVQFTVPVSNYQAIPFRRVD